MRKQRHIPLQQIQPRFSGDLSRSGGDDAQIGASGYGVINGGDDLRAGEESGGVLEIEHFATEFIGFGVDESDLVGEVLGEDGLGYGHSNISGSDDGDFGVAFGG